MSVTDNMPNLMLSVQRAATIRAKMVETEVLLNAQFKLEGEYKLALSSLREWCEASGMPDVASRLVELEVLRRKAADK